MKYQKPAKTVKKFNSFLSHFELNLLTIWQAFGGLVRKGSSELVDGLVDTITLEGSKLSEW